MRVVIASSLILGALCLSACGSDSSSGGAAGSDAGGAGGAGGSSGSAGSSSGGTSATGGTAGTSSGGSAGSGGPTQCGPSLVCAQYSVCIVDEIAPTCTPKTGTEPCPSGQTESQCGGAGTPCCCEPTPPPEYRCEGKGICGAKPDCDCLGPTICHNGQMCMAISGKDWEFHCSDPPVP